MKQAILKSISLLILVFTCFNCSNNEQIYEIEQEQSASRFKVQMLNEKQVLDNSKIELKLKNLFKQSSITKEKELIHSFVSNVILSKNRTYNDYLEIYNKSDKDNKRIIEMVEYVLIAYKDQIKIEGWKNFKILKYNEIQDKSKIKLSKTYKKLEYNDTDKLYFTIFDDNENRVNLFVIENNKIVSFFPHLNIGNDPIEPYLLNIKQE